MTSMFVPTHLETRIDDHHVVLDEPLFARCDLSMFWLAASVVLLAIAIAILVRHRERWHFLVTLPIILLAPLAPLAVHTFVRRPIFGEDLYAIFPAIRYPYARLEIMVAIAACSLLLGLLCAIVKRSGRLRIASAVVAAMSIALVVKGYTCGSAIDAAVTDLWQVPVVPKIDVVRWPKLLHVGQSIAIAYQLTGLLVSHNVDASEWRTRESFTASTPGVVRVPLAVERGPLRVELDKDLLVVRDEGPSWMPLAVGNTWELAFVVGGGDAPNALEDAFKKNAVDPKAPRTNLRVDRELYDRGLHMFVLTLSKTPTSLPYVEEETVYRRDGKLYDDRDNELGTGTIPFLGACHVATTPIDAARTLPGPTICGTTNSSPVRFRLLDDLLDLLRRNSQFHEHVYGLVLVRSGS